jgi:hypothetical protein
MDSFLVELPMIIVLVLFVGMFIIFSGQSQRRLTRWLQSQDYQAARLEEPPLFRPGPFFMLNKRGWGVKRLIVRRADGSERTGWLMYPAGLFVEKLTDQEYQVKLVWDDEWDPNETPLWRQ